MCITMPIVVPPPFVPCVTTSDLYQFNLPCERENRCTVTGTLRNVATCPSLQRSMFTFWLKGVIAANQSRRLQQVRRSL